MKFPKQIQYYTDVLPREMFDKIPSFLIRPRWGLNASHPTYQSHKVFWGMHLNDDQFFNKDVFEIVKKITKKNFNITQILANAQSCLQDGSPHIDGENPKGWTFILYANNEWDFQWGGQTVFFDRYHDLRGKETKKSDAVHTVYPVPNNAVFFPSNMVHYGLGPSRDFYGIRYTIAYHLVEI